MVNIEPIDASVLVGDKIKFSCNFSGKHRVLKDSIVWLKGRIKYKTKEKYFLFILLVLSSDR